MKQFIPQKTLIFAILMLFSLNANCQKINLFDLKNFAIKSLETTNTMLLTNGWEFIGAETTDDLSTIVRWEFIKQDTKEVTNFMELSTFEKQPSSLRYRFNQKEYYLSIMGEISTSGYKLIEDNISNQAVSATYDSPDFSLILNYKRAINQGKEFTSYEITLTSKNKSNVTNLMSKNTLEKKKEFDKDGTLTTEYFLKDGKREGAITYFNPDGTIKKEAQMKSGVENGPATIYNYDTKNKKLLAKSTGTIVNDKQDGIWLKNKITENATFPIEMTTYENGVREGDFQSIRNDSLIFMQYKNDLLEGHYRIFLHKNQDLKITEVDTTQMTRILHGFYVENKKIGLWKSFDPTGSLLDEGYFLNDDKTGIWKYYYPSTAFDSNIPIEYSGKLYLEETYKSAKRNGESIRYSIFKKEEVPCNNTNEKKCYRYVFENSKEKSTLVNNILNGNYELTNADNKIISKGIYNNGKQNGKWILMNDSAIVKRSNKTFETGTFEAGIKEGKWERTDDNNQTLETYSYKNGILDGAYLLFKDNNPIEKWHFKNNVFTELAVLDTSESSPITYILSDFDENSYTCQKSETNSNSICIKTFKVKSIAPKAENVFTYKDDFENMSQDLRVLNGLYVLKNQEKNVLEEGTYLENRKVGKWINFYYDQKVRTDFIYENGNLIAENYFDIKKNEPFSGEFIFKDKNSEISEERKIKDGVRHGTTRYKDLKDKTVKKESYKKGVIKE